MSIILGWSMFALMAIFCCTIWTLNNYEYKNHKKRYPKKYFFLCLLLLYGCYRGYLLDKHDSDLRERKTEALKASEVFSWVEYNRRDEILIVQFEESESRYKYSYVPEEVYEDFIYSDSLGKFYNRHIKGQYQSTPIA